MAAFDAAERELDAAFGRFEGLVARLREWRKIEADAEARAGKAETEALRLVEEALSEVDFSALAGSESRSG